MSEQNGSVAGHYLVVLDRPKKGQELRLFSSYGEAKEWAELQLEGHPNRASAVYVLQAEGTEPFSEKAEYQDALFRMVRALRDIMGKTEEESALHRIARDGLDVRYDALVNHDAAAGQ